MLITLHPRNGFEEGGYIEGGMGEGKEQQFTHFLYFVFSHSFLSASRLYIFAHFFIS
jgi:hypothetical protein